MGKRKKKHRPKGRNKESICLLREGQKKQNRLDALRVQPKTPLRDAEIHYLTLYLESLREKRTRLAAKSEERAKRGVASAYEARDALLLALGFESYEVYRDSSLWASIRKKLLQKGTRCSLCERMATQIHHTSYDKETMLGKDLRHLHPICRTCHETIELDTSGSTPWKRTFQTANEAFEKLRQVEAAKRDDEPLWPAAYFKL